jgi:histone acetyltransferase (RNA polymerase elongator complex component)
LKIELVGFGDLNMKTHAIIPIFIPHKGCPNDCVFCNQNKITLKETPLQDENVSETIDKYLKTLHDKHLKTSLHTHRDSIQTPNSMTVEVAFYGGSFTGIPIDEQSKYLKIASSYKKCGLIDKIHLSTRPDYIDEKILSNLKHYGVDTIELGVQSFDDDVLKKSNRGHDSAIVYKNSALIQEYGFELGLQLMIGLPGDTQEKSIYSAHELVKIKPSIARLYPTIVIENTMLHNMFISGEYNTPTLNEYISTTKTMYRIISSADINVIRIGLRSADLVKKAGTNFHPAFRQLVEAEIAKDIIEEQLHANTNTKPCESADNCNPDNPIPIYVPIKLLSNEKSFSNMIGHHKSNKIYFAEKYPEFQFSYGVDNSLADNQYVVLK